MFGLSKLSDFFLLPVKTFGGGHFKLIFVFTFLLNKFHFVGCLVKSEYRYLFYLLY